MLRRSAWRVPAVWAPTAWNCPSAHGKRGSWIADDRRSHEMGRTGTDVGLKGNDPWQLATNESPDIPELPMFYR